jgi:hypothetical protein
MRSILSKRFVHFSLLILLPAVSAGSADAKIDFSAIKSPIILRGDSVTAYRDPTAIYHKGIFRLYYTMVKLQPDGKRCWVTAESKSKDLVEWTEPRPLTPVDLNKNFSSPGNIIRFGGKWVLCFQTYPTPNGEKYANNDAKVWIMRSDDLENWDEPELMMVKGPDVPVAEMGRLIDAYLVEDKDQPGKWWMFFDDDAANMSWSYDLKTWTYFNRVEAGENVCVLAEDDEYMMFHSPKNGIGVMTSKDLRHWHDTGELITLGQENWPWAYGRISAGFILDLRNDKRVGKCIMFFHGSGPDDERIIFKTHCSLGLAWSDDLKDWKWPEAGRR